MTREEIEAVISNQESAPSWDKALRLARFALRLMDERAGVEAKVWREAASECRKRHIGLDRQKCLSDFSRYIAKHEIACLHAGFEGNAGRLERAKAAAKSAEGREP